MADHPLKQALIRVFLAIPLHAIFHQELDRVLKPLRREIPGIRWVEPRQVHLTLHFFGAISVKEIEPIHHLSTKVAAFFSPLSLKMTRIGGFPGLENPDILWLGIEEDTGGLLSLQKAIQGEIRSQGFRTEPKPFQPHATIGRVKWKNKDLGTSLEQASSVLPTAEKTADHFSLFQSHCLPEGARYEVLKTYPLSQKTQA